MQAVAILFEHLGYINDEDITADWSSDDANGDEWVKIKLIQIDLADNLFLNNELFKQHSIKRKIEKFLSKIEQEEKDRIARETIDFSKPFSEQQQEKQLFEARNKIKDDKISEYHSEIVEKMDADEDDIVSDVTDVTHVKVVTDVKNQRKIITIIVITINTN